MRFPLVLMNRLNKTKSAVFLYNRSSLFLKDLFLQIFFLFARGSSKNHLCQIIFKSAQNFLTMLRMEFQYIIYRITYLFHFGS